jgi:hypothetical protein
MLHETWKDQYDRMKQSFELLKQIGEPTAVPQDVIPAREVVYRFCSHAFHLRDYIAADTGTDEKSINAAIAKLDRDVIKPSPELSACRDIANGSKHLVLHGKSYVTGTKHGHAEVVSHNIDVGAPTMKVEAHMCASVTVTHPDGSTDADDAVAPQPPLPTPPAPAPASGSTDGYILDTFTIDINGQRHDARDVGAKAIAAWDVWLKKQGMI